MKDDQRKAMYAKMGKNPSGISSKIKSKNMSSEKEEYNPIIAERDRLLATGKYKPDSYNGYIRSNRIYNIEDIEKGKDVMNKMDLILRKYYNTKDASASTRLYGNSEQVIDGVLDTLGRDSYILEPFLDYRLSGEHDGKHWIMSIPMPYDKNGGLYVEDHGGFQTDAYKGKVRFQSVSPEVFLKSWASNVDFNNEGSRKAIDKYKKMLIEGKPVGTPFIQVDGKTGKVYSHEGRHRAEASRELGIDKIPVEIISDIPIESMTPMQKYNFLFGKFIKQSH